MSGADIIVMVFMCSCWEMIDETLDQNVVMNSGEKEWND